MRLAAGFGIGVLTVTICLAPPASAVGRGTKPVHHPKSVRATASTPPAATNRSTAAGTGATAVVPSGISAAALPGAAAFGTTPPNLPESVSFVLKARDLSQLKASVEQGVRSYLSVSQFAQTYGQSPAALYAIEVYLAGFGIGTQSYADGLDISASGTAGQFDRALAVQQLQYHVPARPGRPGTQGIPAQTVHGTAKSPRLPVPLARYVLAVLGLTNYVPFTSQAVHAERMSSGHAAVSANRCTRLTGVPTACNLPANFAAEYGLTPLVDGGATGAGQTVGIVTEAALDPGAPQYFWKHVAKLPATTRTVTVDNVDGGPGAPSDASGSGETDIDVEQSGGVAPGADVVVYQTPGSDSGFADAFFTAASQNIAGSVSVSWGMSETLLQVLVAAGEETPAYVTAFDEAFLEMAEQGQSAFAAAGDSGAYSANRDVGTTNLSVVYPGSSSFVTSAGGTTLPWSAEFTGPGGSASVTVPAQRAWGWDYLWPALAARNGQPLSLVAQSDVAGGGGGFSNDETVPSYQRGVSGTNAHEDLPYLTPTGDADLDGILLPLAWSFDPTPPLAHGWTTGRALPDVSTDADPYTGYLLYEPSAAPIGEPTLEGGWGGTSFVAPQLNGSTAVIESYVGHRVGFWNPSIYAFATSTHSPFSPLQQSGTQNDNLFYTGSPGSVFNEATGLGVPDLSQLANDFRGQ